MASLASPKAFMVVAALTKVVPPLTVSESLAVLYEKWGREEEIDLCLNKAMDGFHARDAARDAYYAFNCRKCAVSGPSLPPVNCS